MLYYKIIYIGGIDLRKYSKFLTLLLCTMVALPFTGCGSNSSSDSSSSSSSTSSQDSSDSSGAKETGNSDNSADIENIKYSDYVDIGDYSVISLAKEDIENKTNETVTSNIEQTGDFNKIKKAL